MRRVVNCFQFVFLSGSLTAFGDGEEDEEML